MKHKNIVAEMLRKLLKDNILVFARTGVVKSQLFSEKMQKLLKMYNNRLITSAEEMAQELTKLIRRSRIVDWDKKKSARAYMRTQVKHLLRKYKYPPEKAKGAVDFVIKQVELMSSNINPGSGIYDFQPRTKPLMVAEDSVYGMNEKIMCDLSDKFGAKASSKLLIFINARKAFLGL